MRVSSAARDGRGLGRSLARKVAPFVVASACLIGASAPASAASQWVKVGGQTRHCEYYSFGPVCHTQQKWFRQGSSVCTGDLTVSGRWAYASWYDYCYKYTS